MFPVLSANTLSTGYNINNSLRFRSSASAYLNRTYSSSGTIDTWSVWVKRGKLGSAQTILGTSDGIGISYGIDFTSSDTLDFYEYFSTGYRLRLLTTQVFRDPSAWYHIVIALDTTQATAANRAKIYVNGTQVTAFSVATYPAQNTSLNMANVSAVGIGITGNVGGSLYDGYMAEFNFIDGQALTPSSFGETDTTTGVWKPKAYTGTYGTNGFELNFSDIATTSGSNAGLGKDFSGNANYWNTNNISVTAGVTYDAMIDSPTLTSATVANYAVLNPLQSAVAPTAGNLDFNSGGGEVCPKATIQLPLTGKWYWESFCSATGTDNWIGVTIDQTGTVFTTGSNYRAYRKTGIKESNGTASAYGASWASGDTLGVAVDMDAGTIVFYKNGTSQGTAYSDLAGIRWTVFVYGYINAGHQVNFGQRPFLYTPPTGFVRLNTYNLPDSTIKKGNSYMDATLYTGTGASLSVTNTSAFKPDFVWVKGRSGATDHALYDSVRGTTKDLVSNSTAAETTQAQGLTAFGTSGFTVGTLAKMNTSAATYVGWQWQAGQGSTSSNTSGSITSTVSVNTTAGFSIVTYTGTGASATVGHGLGVAPKFIIVKKRSAADPWVTYHVSLGVQYYTLLNATDASYNNLANYWSATAPSSTVFGLNSYGGNNQSAATYVAYCWAEIAGFSNFGSYTGNGSADGPFVYTGFRPKFILVKITSSVADWIIWDSARNTFNVTNSKLSPNTSGAEYTDTSVVGIDFLSNGFKLKGTDTAVNTSAANYIYMAFAENPFKNANAR